MIWLRRASSTALYPIAAAAAGLLIGLLFIGTSGVDPLEASEALILGAFGNQTAITETLVKAAPLTLAGLGVMFAFRTNTFNIGAEGQLYVGALATTVAALAFPSLGPFAYTILLIVAGAVGGGLWAAIPGYLRATRGTSEIILTIMMNYVAILFVGYLLQGPLQAPGGYLPISPMLPEAAQAPILLQDTRLHGAVLLAPLAALAAYLLLWYTPLGLRMRAVGDTPDAARAMGTSIPRMVIGSMGFSGALAGLAGMVEIVGIHHRLQVDFSPGYGFTAIAVALLGRLSPVGVLFSGLFFAALRVGADTMQRWVGVPASMVYVIQGLVIIFAAAGEYLQTDRGIFGRLKRGLHRG
jgi:ABC-type uncharacterized transport system permease subunit